FPGESGYIERVELANFMCHRRLTIPLGPSLNFIVGHNGSGKSAILTGITVCLGGKATVTQRASNLRSLIREGETSGSVTVWLSNRGADAYEPDKYGEVIRVERKLNRDGSSAYRIRGSRSDKVISDRRIDLTRILDHLNIQVDNPLSILSQDASRAFLQSSSPEDKYRFFLRGTQLGQLESEYAHIAERAITAGAALERKREVLPALQSQVREAELRLRDMEQARELVGRMDALKKELAWSHVAVTEEQAKLAVKEVTEAGKKVPLYERKLQEQNASIIEAKQELDNMEQEMETMRAEDEPSDQRLEAMDRTFDERKAMLEKLKQHEREMNHRIRTLRRDDEAVKDRLKETRERLDNEGLEAKREVDRLTQEVKEADHRLRQILELKATEAQRRVERIKEEVRGREGRAQGHRQRQQQLLADAELNRRIMADLEAQTKNTLLAYGPGMPGLMQAIQRETRWHRPPIGPFGLHMRVRESKWMEVLESLVGQATGDFLVEDHHDQALLISLIRQQGGVNRSKVIVSGRDLFDYSQGEPDRRFLTTLRALEFTDEHVKRQFINAFRIETCILIDSRQEADRVMRSGPGGNPPKNVRRCVTLQGYEVGGGAKGRSTMALSLYHGAPRLRESQKAGGERRIGTRREETRRAIDLATTEAREAENAAYEQDSLAKEARADQVHLEQDQERAEEARDEGQRQHRELESRLEGAKEALKEGARQTLEQKIQVLEQEQEKVRKEMSMIKGQFSSVADQRVDLEDGMARLNKEIHQIREERRARAQRWTQIRNQISKSLSEIDKMNEGKIRYETQLATERARVGNAEEKERALRLEQTRATELANEFCARVPVNKDPETLDREVQALERRLEEAEEGFGCTLAEARAKLRDRAQVYEAAREEVAGLGEDLRLLKRSMASRRIRLERFKEFISRRAQLNFQ
ncbi:P-loop containing nucleoside triphosphate hydrolase protein, partial [Piptocephalis cylindrospora]